MNKLNSVEEMLTSIEQGDIIFQGGFLLWKDKETEEIKYLAGASAKPIVNSGMLNIFIVDFDSFITWRI